MFAPSDVTEKALLQKIAGDDQVAFTALYLRYWETLFVTAARALRGKEEAEDVVQDVFFSLWKRRHEVHIEGSLEAYLQTSVRYKAIHYIEKNITRRNYLALLTETTEKMLPASADLQLDLKEVQWAIQETIVKMPPKMREVYQLSRQENLCHKEIAQKLGISVETVKKHIQNALQLIKTTLAYVSVPIAVLLLHIVY